MIFPLWKSLPGPVRDYLFTVTVTIILKASFLAVLKKLKLQKGEKRCETKDALITVDYEKRLAKVRYALSRAAQTL